MAMCGMSDVILTYAAVVQRSRWAARPRAARPAPARTRRRWRPPRAACTPPGPPGRGPPRAPTAARPTATRRSPGTPRVRELPLFTLHFYIRLGIKHSIVRNRLPRPVPKLIVLYNDSVSFCESSDLGVNVSVSVCKDWFTSKPCVVCSRQGRRQEEQEQQRRRATRRLHQPPARTRYSRARAHTHTHTRAHIHTHTQTLTNTYSMYHVSDNNIHFNLKKP